MKERLPFTQDNSIIQQILFFLIFLFLPTQLGKHFWTNASFLAGTRVDYLSPTIYTTDVLITALFIFCFYRFIKDKEKSLKAENIKTFLKRHWGYVVYPLFLCAGIILSKSPINGWYSLAKLFEFSFFGFSAASFLKKEKKDSLLIWPLIIGVIFESALAIVQFFHQGSINGIFYFLGERSFTGDTPGIANASLNGHLILRPYATFPHPNVLAAYLVIAMTILLFNKQTIFDTLKFFVLLIGTFALLLTLSRVAIFLWTIILFTHFIYWLKKHTRFTFFILFLTILLCFVAILFFLSPLSYRFAQLSFTNESIVQREALSNIAMRIIALHPFFGVGLGNFLPTLPKYIFPNTENTPLQPVHNIFLLIAAETGIIGLGFFLWFLFKTIKRIIQFHQNKTFFNMSMILLLLLIILGIFDHYFLTLQQGQILLALLFSICWSM